MAFVTTDQNPIPRRTWFPWRSEFCISTHDATRMASPSPYREVTARFLALQGPVAGPRAAGDPGGCRGLLLPATAHCSSCPPRMSRWGKHARTEPSAGPRTPAVCSPRAPGCAKSASFRSNRTVLASACLFLSLSISLLSNIEEMMWVVEQNFHLNPGYRACPSDVGQTNRCLTSCFLVFELRDINTYLIGLLGTLREIMFIKPDTAPITYQNYKHLFLSFFNPYLRVCLLI